MPYTYPHTIENGHGEKIIFLRLVPAPDGDWLEVENHVTPNVGPPMHVHHKQAESLTVVQGRIASQVLGEEPKFNGPGETAEFEAGVPHKFWNAGTDTLICRGWIKPAHNVEYFLTEIYKSTVANGGRPGAFDSAWLLQRYRSEFDMFDIPVFVKRVVFPMALFWGKLTGQHKKFKDAPPPVR
jgi:mannose-6-phosphate isomerase-like protein (cupin superfamily)